MIIKTEEERNVFLTAGAHLRQVLDVLREEVKPGVSPGELDSLALQAIEKLDDTPTFLNYKPSGAKRAFPATVCVSVNDEIVHGIPQETVATFQDGDIVSIDCGLKHDGFFVDAAFSVVLGSEEPEKKRLLEATRKALKHAIDACVVGARTGDIGHAVEKVAQEYGYAVPVELGGHGIGRKEHEDPFIPNAGNPGTGEQFRDGETVALEPIFIDGHEPTIRLGKNKFVYKTSDGSLSAHFEHTILITDDGPVIATGPMW